MKSKKPMFVVLTFIVIVLVIVSIDLLFKAQSAQAKEPTQNQKGSVQQVGNLGENFLIYASKGTTLVPRTCISIVPKSQGLGASFDCFVTAVNYRSAVPQMIGDMGTYELWEIKIDIEMQPDKACLVQIPKANVTVGNVTIRCLS